MTLSIVVLPLRLTNDRQDVAGMIADAMDSDQSIELSSMD
jgi:hypothetical protein